MNENLNLSEFIHGTNQVKLAGLRTGTNDIFYYVDDEISVHLQGGDLLLMLGFDLQNDFVHLTEKFKSGRGSNKREFHDRLNLSFRYHLPPKMLNLYKYLKRWTDEDSDDFRERAIKFHSSILPPTLQTCSSRKKSKKEE